MRATAAAARPPAREVWGASEQTAAGERCPSGDLNPHGLSHWNLNPARLPIPPDGRGNPTDSRQIEGFRPALPARSCLPGLAARSACPEWVPTMEVSASGAMLATIGGSLALLLGLAILLLPLLATELSRPRDSFWGAVVLLLGLVLVTSTERLTGAPMLAVLSGGLLIGRLGSEVGLGRWRQLTPEERSRLGSGERWRSSLAQLGASATRLLQMVGEGLGGVGAWIAERRKAPATTKRWVRPEEPSPPAPSAPTAAEEPRSDPGAEAPEAESPAQPADDDSLHGALVVSGFEEIDALIREAPAPEEEGKPAGNDEAG